MTTNTMHKVDTKWDVKTTQERTSNMIAVLNFAAFETLSKVSPEALVEYQAVVRKHKVEAYKAMGIKTPLQLVEAMAETEHNLFGNTVEISGDDAKAQLTHVSHHVWDAMNKIAKFTPEQQEKMHKNMEACTSLTAKELGMTGTVSMDKDKKQMTVTFTK